MSYNSNQGNYYRPSMQGGFQFFPPVIKWLLIANAGIFVVLGLFAKMFTIQQVPLNFYINYYLGLMPLGSGYFYPWQLITYQFLHADIWHLLYNMFFGLWMFGMEVEHVWGSRKFFFFYIICGIVAGLTQLLVTPLIDPQSVTGAMGNPIPTIGASGAVYGVLVAFAMLFPDRYILFYFFVPVKVKYFVMGLIVLGVLSVGSDSQVANLAHLGGALSGYIYFLYDSRRLPLEHLIARARWWINSKSVKQSSDQEDQVIDTPVFDINDAPKKSPDLITQKQIDQILDKISQGGYQSLSEEEKKTLFEVSKKIN
ncbi:MAG: rhomboid family intramembrane serine protease [bacterium]